MFAKRCQLPKCKQAADTAFATVPVCEAHRLLLQEEAESFYRGHGNESKHPRPVYDKIRHLTKWVKK